MLIDPARLDRAAATLAAGVVVAVPTDTVYGLAAAVRVPGATARLFALKVRPRSVALPVLVADADDALALAAPEDRDAVARCARRFWPGALTVVVRRAADIAASLGGDESTIGLRVPASGVVRRLAATVGPLAVSSANRHGEPPCQTADDVRRAFAGIDVVDGGTCAGVPSTVIDLAHGGTVLRAGPVDAHAVREAMHGTGQ